MSFAEIIGHQKQIKRIKNAIRNDKMGHAYLFCGPEGIGKKKVAMAVIAYVNCFYPDKEQIESCGTCGSCLRIIRDNQPDFFQITDHEGSIKIEQVRKLASNLSFKNVNTNYKCVIIDNCELLTTEASNSLLKVMEEPSDNTVFFLITRNEHQILETIQSRSQKMAFQELSDKELTLLYQQRPEGIVPLTEVLPFAQGSFSKLLQLTEDEEFLSEVESFRELIETMRTKHNFEMMHQTKIFEKDKNRLQRFLAYYLYLLEGALKNEADMMQKHLHGVTAEQVRAIVEEIIKAQEMMIRNINSRLIAEMVLLNSKKILKGS